MQFVVIEKETEQKTDSDTKTETEIEREKRVGYRVHQSALNYFHNWSEDKRQFPI